MTNNNDPNLSAAERIRQQVEDMLTSKAGCTVTNLKLVSMLAPSTALKMTNSIGNTPLHIACSYRSPSNNITITDQDSTSSPQPINHNRRKISVGGASETNYSVSQQLKVIKYLFKQYPASMDVLNHDGYSPLDIALVTAAPLEIIKFLSDASPLTLKIRNFSPIATALHLAIVHAAASGKAVRVDVVEYLLQHHPPVESFLSKALDANQNSLVHFMILHHHADDSVHMPLSILQAVVNRFPRILGASNLSGQTALHLALQQENVSLALVRFLVQKSHKLVPAYDCRQNTPLHIACNSPTTPLEVIQLLVQTYPRALEKRNFDRNTPLHCAAKQFQQSSSCGTKSNSDTTSLLEDRIRYLMKAGPQALAKTNGFYETPLHIICKTVDAKLTLIEAMIARFPAACLFSYFYHDLPLHGMPYVSGKTEKYNSDRFAQVQAATAGVAQALLEAIHLCQLELPNDDTFDPNSLIQLSQNYANGNKKAVSIGLLDTHHQVAELERRINNADHDDSSEEEEDHGDDDDFEDTADISNSSNTSSDDEVVGRWNLELWIWIRRSRNSSLISTLYRMKQAGRHYFHTDAGDISKGFQVLEAAKDNLTCLYLHLLENPVLCERMRW